MCGFVGICKKKNKLSDQDIEDINSISNKLYHRGPNQSSNWLNSEKNVFLAHRRLSINDLTSNGIQPMKSNSGRYVIIFNGEIYNFLDLKKNYTPKDYNFKSSSDTEVLLALIEKHGIYESLKKLNGMFAFVLYDLKLNKVFLARDCAGQKPLYYYKDENCFFFTSELRGLNLKGLKKKLSKEALQYFFQLSYIPAPLTIYENVYKIKRGTVIDLDVNTFELKEKKIIREKNFYDLKNKNFNEKLNIFDQIFSQVASDHLISDVNNGTLLSGGVDSSLVTYYANKVSNNKINSYCVKSINTDYDESEYAKKIASKIGSNHTTLEFSKNDFFHEVINIHKVYDEPFGDSSQIPTYLLFKSVKENIRVALSGDGGDEVFLGYNRYLFLNKYYNKLKFFNYSSRKILSKALNLISENKLNQIGKILNLNYFNFGNKISKVSNALQFNNLEEFYFQIVRQDYNIDNLVKLNTENKKSYIEQIKFKFDLNNLDNFQKLDFDTYLCDDIFVKVDRASMYNSVESRAPFVDNRLIDFACELDSQEKIKKNNAKYFLKKILDRNMPDINFNRPKMGFGNPIGLFLNNELNEWATNLIYNNNDFIENLINIEHVQKIWKLHQINKKDYSNIIWNFLILKNWILNNEIN